MNNKLVFCLLILFACLKSSIAATKRQAVLGSTAVPAGNPNLPTFTLTPAQTQALPPIDPDIYQDSLLPAPLLPYKRGYVTEIHRVVTSDGYILEVHRIVSSPVYKPSSKVKPVAFLQHGFLDSSATWVMSGPNHALGYALADQGILNFAIDRIRNIKLVIELRK